MAAGLALAGLAACAPVGETPDRRAAAPDEHVPAPRFGPPNPLPPARANARIAADILDLSFTMESGSPIERLSRFEGPVTVGLSGEVPAGAPAQLDRLLERLRDEAGLDVSRAGTGETARINVEFVPAARLRRAVPAASCFIVPNVTDWEAFRRHRRGTRTDWRALVRRERVAMFVPSDASPEERRDCLHEELAQALGPLNDLYRLSESVFNDDNMQGALTGFDMLVLAAYNARELSSGMTRAEVAERLPGILARLNPAGERAPETPARAPAPRAWIEAVETALGDRSEASRRRAARRALTLAREAGWEADPRMAFSLFTLARLARPGEGGAALAALTRAATIYRDLPGATVQAAHVEMHLAANALAIGRLDAARELSTRNLETAARSESAGLLASLMMIRAEVLERTGRPAEARALRLDSLGWARYALGSDRAARERLAEIAGLAPPEQRAEAR